MKERDKYLNQVFGCFLSGYGGGNAVPGAGTAAANTSMIAAQLLITVIIKTLDKKSYSHIHTQIREMKTDIETRIYPRLEFLFQEDSDKFRVHMRFRKINKEKLREEKLHRLEYLKQETLKPCTEIPLEIASLSKDLSGYALFLANYGFVAVRGDSTVALNQSVSSIGGCIGIVNLNLLYFESTDWSDYIKSQVNKLIENWVKLNNQIKLHQQSQIDELKWNDKYRDEFIDKYSKSLKDKNLSFEEIESLVYEMQRTLWRFKKAIWKHKTPMEPFQVLDPNKILELLDYRYEKRESLGSYRLAGKDIETAGITDNKNKIVATSNKHSIEVQRFTLCHELAHVILHGAEKIYRDGPVNGIFSSNGNIIERQADKFATFFTMPSKLVKSEFKKTFGVDVMKINEDSAFAFNKISTDKFKSQVRDLDGFAKFLASVEQYNHHNFDSMAKRFRVSESAMAIRLKELNLLEY